VRLVGGQVEVDLPGAENEAPDGALVDTYVVEHRLEAPA